MGFVVDGQPFVIPTSYGRSGANLYIHGSAASRMLRQMKESVPVCITVTLIDGLVLARSVFNHSMNYRSVVILGEATLVDEPAEKLEALRLLSEHILPGRWEDSRKPNERELKTTSVLRLPIEEFSAKVRMGPAVDDEEDYSFPLHGQELCRWIWWRESRSTTRQTVGGKRSAGILEAVFARTSGIAC